MQISQEVFPYVIGYHGETAIVDKKLKKACAGKSLAQLMADGHLKVAFCQALFLGEEKMQEVTQLYNAESHSNYTIAGMQRLLGVFEITQAKTIRYI